MQYKHDNLGFVIFKGVKVKTKLEVHIYLMWALQYIHDNLAYHLLGATQKVIPVSENRQINYKLNKTLGTGHMGVNVKTKYKVHIYIMWAL